MTIMSSFRLKTHFNGSFQLSVSILTNILVIFLQHLLTIRMILSPAKHEQTKVTQQQILSHLKKVDVSRFLVVSNEATQELISVAVNKDSQNTPGLRKTMTERTFPKLVPVRPSWKYLETNGAARTWQGPEYQVLCQGHTKNEDDNKLESLKIMQSATERYLKEKKLSTWHRALGGVS